jgi:hypothetical protein
MTPVFYMTPVFDPCVITADEKKMVLTVLKENIMVQAKVSMNAKEAENKGHKDALSVVDAALKTPGLQAQGGARSKVTRTPLLALPVSLQPRSPTTAKSPLQLPKPGRK